MSLEGVAKTILPPLYFVCGAHLNDEIVNQWQQLYEDWPAFQQKLNEPDLLGGNFEIVHNENIDDITFQVLLDRVQRAITDEIKRDAFVMMATFSHENPEELAEPPEPLNAVASFKY